MSNMKMVNLGDFCISQQKSKIKAGCGLANGKYKFFTSSNTQSKFLNEFYYSEPALIFGTGGIASIHYCNEPFSTSTDCIVFFGDGTINLKTVYLYLSSKMHVIEEGFKGAGLKHVSKDYILNIKIPLPTFEEQKKIAEVLDKASDLIVLRKKQLERLELIVKSWFINNCAIQSPEYETWNIITIKNIVCNRKGSMRSGPFGSDLLHEEFVDSGIFVLGIDNAVENRFVWNRMRYITEEKYEKLKRYTVYPEDVIITIMATVGKSAVIPKQFPKAINSKHLACLTIDKEKANPYFIAYCIHSHPYVFNQLKMQSKGAIMDGLNLTIIKNIEIPLPPLLLQNQFAEFVEQAEKQKEIIQKSLEILETNYKALVQKYFN